MARSRAIAGSCVMFSTSNTFTRLYRFASMRRAWAGFVSPVMVMRETSGFSVRPTVSESILKARRRNSDATRVSTPGLFSTYTTKIFSMLALFVSGGFDNGTGPPDHIVQGGARRHHGVDGVLLFYLEVEQYRPVVIARLAHRGQDLRTLSYGHTPDAVSLRHFHEIRIQQRRGLVVALVEKFLPLADHSQIAVVDDGNVDFQFFLNEGGHFRHGHLEAAITHYHPDLGLWTRHLGSNGGGQGKAHRSQTAGSDQRAWMFVLVVLRFPHLVLADVGHHHRIAAAGLTPQIVDHMRRVQVAVVGKFLDVAYRRITLQTVDGVQPLAMIDRLNARQ